MDLPSRSLRLEVRVELKPGVLDAEGESVEKSLGLLGIAGVRKVSTARLYDLEFVDVTPAKRTDAPRKPWTGSSPIR